MILTDIYRSTETKLKTREDLERHDEFVVQGTTTTLRWTKLKDSLVDRTDKVEVSPWTVHWQENKERSWWKWKSSQLFCGFLAVAQHPNFTQIWANQWDVIVEYLSTLYWSIKMSLEWNVQTHSILWRVFSLHCGAFGTIWGSWFRLHSDSPTPWIKLGLFEQTSKH